MGLNELKVDVAREILNSKDEELIKFVAALFKSQALSEPAGEFDDLPERVKESIKISREQLERGEFHSLEEVKQMIFRK